MTGVADVASCRHVREWDDRLAEIRACPWQMLLDSRGRPAMCEEDGERIRAEILRVMDTCRTRAINEARRARALLRARAMLDGRDPPVGGAL